MLVYSALFSFVSVTVLVIALGKMGDRKITDRLAILQEHRGRIELTRPLNERLLNPVRTRLVILIGKNLPAERRQRVQNALHRAGNPGNMNPAEFITLKTALTLILSLTVGIFGISGQSPGRLIMLMTMAGMTGWYGPDLFINLRAEQRTQQIKKSISDVLDLITVCVEAGIGFDGAMAKVAEKGFGPLKDEFKRVLQEVMVGKPRKEALRGMAAKNKVEELNNFANAVVQAEQLGLGIAVVLRQQADQARLRRKQRIEEQAMKAPVKMLFPLVFFIFPAIFVVLLGPALIQIMTVLLPK